MHLHFAVIVPPEALGQSEPIRQKGNGQHVVFQSGTLIQGRSGRVKPAALKEEAAHVSEVSHGKDHTCQDIS